ncbi:MAG: formate dehydrogenase accessory protein FdhE [Deltaproteobacteria bacterium]
MVKSLDQIKERIAWFQKERPYYREILDLYGHVVEEQVKILPLLKVTVPEVTKKLVKSRWGKGLPLLGREGFAVDLEAAQKLFHTITAIGQLSTSKMGDEIPRITEAIETGELNLSELLSKHYDALHLVHEAERCGLDTGVLGFLVQASIRPSVIVQMEQLQGALDLEGWLRGECPLCGSVPQMALLRDEGGKRYLQCSFCGCQWRWERIACPSCNNKAMDSAKAISRRWMPASWITIPISILRISSLFTSTFWLWRRDTEGLLPPLGAHRRYLREARLGLLKKRSAILVQDGMAKEIED